MSIVWELKPCWKKPRYRTIKEILNRHEIALLLLCKVIKHYALLYTQTIVTSNLDVRMTFSKLFKNIQNHQHK